MCNDGLVPEANVPPSGESASERMLRILRGVEIEPQQTSDDVDSDKSDADRDKQLKDDVPPHHGT
jgi:hypothetical protein